jgi:hypothetical protein
MQRMITVLLIAAICSVVSGIEHPHWQKLEMVTPDASTIVKIGVALRQENLDLLTVHFLFSHL